jgi:hypothetical protein
MQRSGRVTGDDGGMQARGSSGREEALWYLERPEETSAAGFALVGGSQAVGLASSPHPRRGIFVSGLRSQIAIVGMGGVLLRVAASLCQADASI